MLKVIQVNLENVTWRSSGKSISHKKALIMPSTATSENKQPSRWAKKPIEVAGLRDRKCLQVNSPRNSRHAALNSDWWVLGSESDFIPAHLFFHNSSLDKRFMCSLRPVTWPVPNTAGSAITLEPLTGEVNSTDYLVTVETWVTV